MLATDPESGVTEEKAVVETYVRETGQLVHLRVGGELISTTPNHPFWVKGRGFVSAGELQAGEELVNAAGEVCRVENIRPEIVESPERVYNFQVEGFHTYHVGSIGVLVHNTDCGGDTASSYGIDMDNLNFSNTVQNHTGRPYQDSKLLINEIIESKPPVPDPRGTNALSWTVEGTFNGSIGCYELIIDPTSNTVWHFVFKSQ